MLSTGATVESLSSVPAASDGSLLRRRLRRRRCGAGSRAAGPMSEDDEACLSPGRRRGEVSSAPLPGGGMTASPRSEPDGVVVAGAEAPEWLGREWGRFGCGVSRFWCGGGWVGVLWCPEEVFGAPSPSWSLLYGIGAGLCGSPPLEGLIGIG